MQLFFLLAVCSCFFFVCTVYLVFVSSEVYTFNNIGSKFHFVCSVVPSGLPYMTGASYKFLYKQIICCKHINNKIFFATINNPTVFAQESPTF